MAFSAYNHNNRRSTMKVSQAVDFHLQYQRANSKTKYHQDVSVCTCPVRYQLKNLKARYT